MFFSFAYLGFRALLGLLVRSQRGPDLKDIELMVVRHADPPHGGKHGPSARPLTPPR